MNVGAPLVQHSFGGQAVYDASGTDTGRAVRPSNGSLHNPALCSSPGLRCVLRPGGEQGSRSLKSRQAAHTPWLEVATVELRGGRGTTCAMWARGPAASPPIDLG